MTLTLNRLAIVLVILAACALAWSSTMKPATSTVAHDPLRIGGSRRDVSAPPPPAAREPPRAADGPVVPPSAGPPSPRPVASVAPRGVERQETRPFTLTDEAVASQSSACGGVLHVADGFAVSGAGGLRVCARASAAAPTVLAPTCPIDSFKRSARPLHSSTTCGDCAKSFDLALAGDLYRPQHTMQFLFSLMGLVALQTSLDLYSAAVPVFVNVMRYGSVGSAAEFCRANFAHFELLDLLSPTNDVYLYRDAEWHAHTIDGADLADQGPRRIATACALPVPRQSTTATQFCVRKVVYGSIPVRLPGKKYKADPNLKPHHFQHFRARMISQWDIGSPPPPPPPSPPPSSSSSSSSPSPDAGSFDVGGGGSGGGGLLDRDGAALPYILVVQRRAANGRQLLQWRRVADVVQRAMQNLTRGTVKYGIRLVHWEGKALREQLHLAIHARAMIGVHGNGLTWACFMPERSFVIELSSSIPKKNEVAEGANMYNAGNIAPSCGMRSLSLRSAWVESATSTTVPNHHRWKAVDILPGERELSAIKTFIESHASP